MILQTTGGIKQQDFSDPLFPLGPWCAEGNHRPELTAEDLPADFDLNVTETTDQILQSLEPRLYSILNELHGANLGPTVWKNSLGTYLRVLTPLVVTRYNLIKRVVDHRGCHEFTNVSVDATQLIPNDRTELLVSLNSHSWNHDLLAELCISLGLRPRNPEQQLSLQPHDPTASQQLHRPSGNRTKTLTMRAFNFLAARSQTLITRTMLPSHLDLKLALRMKTLPYFWFDDFMFSQHTDRQARHRIIELLQCDTKPADLLINAIVRRLPKVFIEDFSRARSVAKMRFPQFPRRVFTSNLHQSSDVFLLWLSEVREQGTHIIIAQHGGVHSLCRDVPADISAEIELSNRYIAWGNRSYISPKVQQGPTLVNVGRKRIKRSHRSSPRSLLIVLDASYRYPSIPRGMNGSRFDYAAHITDLINRLDQEVVSKIVLRPYRGAEIWDDSILDLLPKSPWVEIDTTFPPIESLYASAHMVLSTSLGTTFFQTIFHKVPSVVFLNSELSPLSEWASQGLRPLEAASVLHFETESLAEHINMVFHDPVRWWESMSVQNAISSFENEMSPVCKSPISFYVNELTTP